MTVSARRQDDVQTTLTRRRRAELGHPTHDVIAPSHIGEGLATRHRRGTDDRPVGCPKGPHMTIQPISTALGDPQRHDFSLRTAEGVHAMRLSLLSPPVPGSPPGVALVTS